MVEPYSIQIEELRLWGYDVTAPWPSQDFDLMVAEVCFSEIIIQLAIDDNCPKKDFFLSCAYIIIGDAVMTEYSSRSKEAIDEFLVSIKKENHEKLDLLYQRAIALMQDPTIFDYDLWCSEGYIKLDSTQFG